MAAVSAPTVKAIVREVMMAKAALDPELVKSLYDRKAKHYDEQHAFFTLKSDERGRRMVVDHGVKRGDRVLDAGGGTGGTALRAARAVGPEGKVVLLDFSRGMLEQAEQRAQGVGLADRMEFVAGNILELPFDDESFDAVLSTYSVCPLYDPAEGALELYRVLALGGRLAVAHSAEPESPVLRRLASRLEEVVWRFPSLSMGCRPVSTLPALQEAGAELLEKKTFGVPLYPFLFYVVGKPAR